MSDIVSEAARRLREWRGGLEATTFVAARLLEIDETTYVAMESGEIDIPHVLHVHCAAVSAGRPLPWPSLPRERWVDLVANLRSYLSGAGAMPRMDAVGRADFLAFVRRGPDPALARTDSALFVTLRRAQETALLAGLGDETERERP